MNLLQLATEILGLGTAKPNGKKVPLSHRHRTKLLACARRLSFEQVEDRRLLTGSP